MAKKLEALPIEVDASEIEQSWGDDGRIALLTE